MTSDVPHPERYLVEKASRMYKREGPKTVQLSRKRGACSGRTTRNSSDKRRCARDRCRPSERRRCGDRFSLRCSSLRRRIIAPRLGGTRITYNNRRRGAGRSSEAQDQGGTEQDERH